MEQSTAIGVHDLVVELGGRQILHGISFDVAHGDVFGFIGPNGAGKTTTIRSMLGLYEPAGGHVTIAGEIAGTAAARARTGFALDQDGLYGDLTAVANIAYFLALYGHAGGTARATEVLEQVGLGDRATDRVGSFSKGMRQRVAIARAIAHDPSVVIMDEPTSGVDPVAQTQIHDLIASLVKDHGKTVLLSSHNLDEIQRMCNRIALIAQGRILLADDLATLSAQRGEQQITITTAAPVTDETARILTNDRTLGVTDIQGTSIRMRPPHRREVSDVVATLAQHDVQISDLSTDRARLEQIFSDAVTDAVAHPPEPPPTRGARRGRRRP